MQYTEVTNHVFVERHEHQATNLEATIIGCELIPAAGCLVQRDVEGVMDLIKKTMSAY